MRFRSLKAFRNPRALITKALPLIASIASIVNPVVGLALAAITAGWNISENERACRKRNTCIDKEADKIEGESLAELQWQTAGATQKLQLDHSTTLEKLKKAHEADQQTYDALKIYLEKRGSHIDRLDDIIEILEACAAGDDQKVLAGYAEFKNDIEALAEWGFLHILLLSKNLELFRSIYNSCNEEIELLEDDLLGHNLIEYAHLVGFSDIIFQTQTLLIQAKQESCIKFAKQKSTLLLEELDYVNTGNGMTPLQFAVSKKHLLLVKNLTIQNDDTYCSNATTFPSPFQAAYAMPIEEGFEVLKTLAMFSVKFGGVFPQDAHPKYHALNRSCNWLMINSFPNGVDGSNGFGWLPICVATRNQESNVIADFIQIGINVNQSEWVGDCDTALIIAARIGNQLIIKLLLENGADPWITNSLGHNAFAVTDKYTRDIIYEYVNKEPKQYYPAKDNQNSQQYDAMKLRYSGMLQNATGVLQKAGLHKLQTDIEPTLYRDGDQIIMQGLYLLGLQQIIPTSVEELPFLCELLNLSVVFTYKHKKTNKYCTDVSGNKANPEVVVWETPNGCKAIVHGTEFDLQGLNYQRQQAVSCVSDLGVPQISGVTAQEYTANWQNLLQFKLAVWKAQSIIPIVSLERESIPNSIIKPSCKMNDFYVYNMPAHDTGYHALGISRMNAAKQLLEHALDQDVKNYISIAASFTEFESFENYVAHYVAAPGNPTNILHIEVVKALAHINNLTVNIWHEAAGDLEISRSISGINAKKVIDLWCKSNDLDYLENVAVLHTSADLIITPVPTHIDIMTRSDQETAYNAIMHGWQLYTQRETGIVVQDDLLAMLVLCKSILNKQDLTDQMFISELYNIRQQLVAKLARLMENNLKIKTNISLSQYEDWTYRDKMYTLLKQIRQEPEFKYEYFGVARNKLQDIARLEFMSSHCMQLNHYKENLDDYKVALNKELHNSLESLESQQQASQNAQAKELQDLESWRLEIEASIANFNCERAAEIRNHLTNVRKAEHETTRTQRRKGTQSAGKYLAAFAASTAIMSNATLKASPVTAGAVCGGVRSGIMSGGKLKEIGKGIVTGAIQAQIGEAAANLKILDDKLINAAAMGAIEGMIETTISGGNRKDILKSAGYGALRGVAAMQMKEKVQFSDSRMQAAVSGAVRGIITGYQHDKRNFADLLGYALEAAGYAVANKINQQKIAKAEFLDSIMKQGLVKPTYLPNYNIEVDFSTAANGRDETNSNTNSTGAAEPASARVVPKVKKPKSKQSGVAPASKATAQKSATGNANKSKFDDAKYNSEYDDKRSALQSGIFNEAGLKNKRFTQSYDTQAAEHTKAFAESVGLPYNEPDVDYINVRDIARMYRHAGSSEPSRALPKRNFFNNAKNFYEKVAIDADQFQTDFYDRSVQGEFEFDVLKGQAVGIGKAGFDIATWPVRTVLNVFSAAEEFQSVFNGDILTDSHNDDKASLLNQYKQTNNSIAKGFDAVNYAVHNPGKSALKGLYNFGGNVVNLCESGAVDGFDKGVDLGYNSVMARFALSSAKPAAITTLYTAGWTINAGVRGVRAVGLDLKGVLVNGAKNNKPSLLFNFDRQVATISASSPGEIYRGYGTISERQQRILDLLPKDLSRIKLHKSDIKINDMAALTAYTGDEFALFTRGSQRLVVRGNRSNVDLLESELLGMKSEGFRWSAHTHPGVQNVKLDASGGDRWVLELIKQERSLILNSAADRNVFDVINNIRITENSRDVTKFKFAEWNPITKVQL